MVHPPPLSTRAHARVPYTGLCGSAVDADRPGVIFGEQGGAQHDEIVIPLESGAELVAEHFVPAAHAARNRQTIGIAQRLLERERRVFPVLLVLRPRGHGSTRRREQSGYQNGACDPKSSGGIATPPVVRWASGVAVRCPNGVFR